MKITSAMKQCIELEIQNPSWSARQIAEALGKHMNTIYGWWRDPDYKAARDARLRELWNESTKIAQKTMIDLAKGGDFRASQYILDSAGYAPAQKIEANVDNVIKVFIDD